MNAVDLFDTLGYLDRVLWVSKDQNRVRILKRNGETLLVAVELPFCKTWVKDRSWTLDDFLRQHRPLR